MVSLRSAAAGRITAVPARSARYWACLLWLPLAWSAAAGAQTPTWRTLSDKDGIRLEARSIPGERFDELRVTASLKVSPQAVAEYPAGQIPRREEQEHRAPLRPARAGPGDLVRRAQHPGDQRSLLLDAFRPAGSRRRRDPGEIRIARLCRQNSEAGLCGAAVARRMDPRPDRGRNAVDLFVADRHRRQGAGVSGPAFAGVGGGIQRKQGGRGRFGTAAAARDRRLSDPASGQAARRWPPALPPKASRCAHDCAAAPARAGLSTATRQKQGPCSISTRPWNTPKVETMPVQSINRAPTRLLELS